MVLVFFSATVLKGAFLAIHDILVARVVASTLQELRVIVFQKVVNADLALFDSNGPSRLLARCTHDLEGVTAGLGTFFGPVILEPLKALSCLIAAAFVSWRLLLMSFIVAPAAVIAIRYLLRRVKELNHESMAAMSEVYARLNEAFLGIFVIKAFTLEQHKTSEFADTCNKINRRILRMQSARALVKPLVELLGSAAISTALLVGGYYVLHPTTTTSIRLDPPQLILFFGLMIGATDPFRKISGVGFQIRRSLVASERISAIVNQQPLVAELPHTDALGSTLQRIEIDDVHFGYSARKKALRGLSAVFRRGEVTAIVGANGSGKTSLIKLLLRLYDPQAGEIRFDGVDLRKLKLRNVRDQIGIVTQSVFLFDDNVLENIRLGRPGASDSDVVEAARLSGAHDFIMRDLAQGYDTRVGEGCQRLSGGQAQRIALARAILRNPKILILDEATSNIDPRAEANLVTTLKDFLRQRITIIVCHRESTLSFADRVLVMRKGIVADGGTTQELAIRCPPFRRLFPHTSSIAS